MNTPKELLSADKDLRDRLAAVTQADWFHRCLAFVKSELFNRDGLTADHLKGARMFEEILVSIAAPDAPEEEPLTSGLVYSLPTKQTTDKENTDHA